ncbi:MAG TPA: hypothetical protein VFR67_21800 [Pilimelia sp.]|nr:hypothetical protein [Pilimelia sp.]
MASTVALWFGFGGPNLMVCSGARAGSDGLWLAGLLLRAGRADRVVLVGTEPDDEVASALYAADDPPRPPRDGRATDDPPRPLRAGAACVVLRAWRPEAPGTTREALVELAPGAASVVPPLTVGPGGFDPVRHWGDCYGAQGVVALALAAHLAVDEGFGGVGVPCETSDGSRAALVAPAGPAAIGGNR